MNVNANNLPLWLILAALVAFVVGVRFWPNSDTETRDLAIAEGMRLARVEMAKDCWLQSEGSAGSLIEATKCLKEHVR